MLLADANVWLELLLEQERAEEVRRLLDAVPLEELAVTEFSVCAIGLLLTRAKRDDLFLRFVSDVLLDTSITRIALDGEALKDTVTARKRFGLDFDDAYQYVAAEKHNLTLVSFDADFDRTDRGRKTPADILGEPPVARDKPPTKPARRRSRKP
jgi:predicted nucleic acid-binding protein